MTSQNNCSPSVQGLAIVTLAVTAYILFYIGLLMEGFAAGLSGSIVWIIAMVWMDYIFDTGIFDW